MSDVNKSDKPINGKQPKHIKEAFAAREHEVSHERLSDLKGHQKLTEKLEGVEALRGKFTPNSAEYTSATEN